MTRLKIKIAAVALSMITTGVGAQTLSQAQRWFTQGEFEKAKPVFKKLVKQSPSNASYNFWYGACCYETGEMLEGLPYLEKSASRKVINAYLYVSKAYYDMYRYEDAIENLEQHIYWLEKKNRDTSAAEELMTKYRKGERLIRSVEDITVVDSFVVDKQNFLEAYKLGGQAGTLGITTDSVGGEDICIEFINEMGDKKLLSVRDENGNKKLYSSVKLIDKWSKPQRLKGINDDMTELNYPFLDSDGTTLYFSAKGEESLGGYDIYVTRADSEENSYFKPDNLGYPFNSAYNDYMYAIDDYNNLGWFASDRYQPEGKVCVYVFIPNDSKITYDYDALGAEKMISLAKLDNIAITQADKEAVVRAKQRLAKVTYSGSNKKEQKTDFEFIVNDNRTYTSLNDFRNKEAKKLFQEMNKMKKDLKELENELDGLRKKYSTSGNDMKKSIAPGIIDKEQRVESLRKEIETMTRRIRNLELK
ncbi:CDC27 family protein [uncultured Bacteroides sp.]|uniref:tetratricopeptide repeat protein n=1 Tax=uncultured Bacteroides sp. TaxID=162156 RepID=UPI00262AACFA|nr:CDC27 family protein [uncultured Bacteroides sp.]